MVLFFSKIGYGISQGVLLHISQPDFSCEQFISSAEIIPFQPGSIVYLAPVSALKKAAEIPVGILQDRDRPDVPTLRYLNDHIDIVISQVFNIKRNKIENGQVQKVFPAPLQRGY